MEAGSSLFPPNAVRFLLGMVPSTPAAAANSRFVNPLALHSRMSIAHSCAPIRISHR